VGRGDCLTQAGDRDVRRSGVEGREPGFQLRGNARRRGRAYGRVARGWDDSGTTDGVTGLDAELAAEESHARVALAFRGRPVAGHGVGADEELLRLLVERVHGDDAGGELHRLPRVPGGELGQGSLVQHVLRRRGEPPTFREQPHLERWAGRKRYSFEKFPSQARYVQRLNPRPRGQCVDVDECARREPQSDGLAADRATGADEPAELSEIPAQRVERILRVGEEEVGEPLAARGGFGR